MVVLFVCGHGFLDLCLDYNPSSGSTRGHGTTKFKRPFSSNLTPSKPASPIFRGTFRFERPDGSHFDVRIPPFSLESNKDEKTPPSGLHW